MPDEQPLGKLIYLTAGAAGMYCGSCMHDNALANSLLKVGWDIQLVPTYTPIRTDEMDHSVDQVFFGGINVYLQQKLPFLRYLPRFLDRFLDNPKLIRRVTSSSINMSPKFLGELAVSMLKGSKGNQRKEVKRLCQFLVEEAPDAIVFTNILIGGCIPEIKKIMQVPVLVTLQGDDVFLDSLLPRHKSKCIELIQSISENVDGFIVHSEFFRTYMAEYFQIPEQKIHVTELGLDVKDFAVCLEEPGSDPRSDLDRPPTIGYLARLAPQKGFHLLVDAFIKLKQQPGFENAQLRIAGWLGEDHTAFAESEFEKLRAAGLGADFEYLGSVSRKQKVELLTSIDVLCVPTEFLEPKGLYALESLAAGTPILKPAHGCFPELVEKSGGGFLFNPLDVNELASTLSTLLSDREKLFEVGKQGQAYVHQHRNAASMAASTTRLIQSFLS